MSGTIVYFHTAPWCPNCKAIKPTVEKLCRERGATLVIVDVDVMEPLIPNLTSIPAVMVDKPNEEPIVLLSSAVNPRTLAVAI